MKRGALNSLENSKLVSKYNALLEDYLELQKESLDNCIRDLDHNLNPLVWGYDAWIFQNGQHTSTRMLQEYVSKKRKLQAEKQKQDVLRDEVRFLRQRHMYLTKSRSAKAETEPGPRQNVDIHAVPIRMERNDVVNETNMEQNVNGKEELVRKALIVKKQPQNMSLKKKKTGKGKISWPDKVALRV